MNNSEPSMIGLRDANSPALISISCDHSAVFVCKFSVWSVVSNVRTLIFNEYEPASRFLPKFHKLFAPVATVDVPVNAPLI